MRDFEVLELTSDVQNPARNRRNRSSIEGMEVFPKGTRFIYRPRLEREKHDAYPASVKLMEKGISFWCRDARIADAMKASSAPAAPDDVRTIYAIITGEDPYSSDLEAVMNSLLKEHPSTITPMLREAVRKHNEEE